MSLEEQTLLMYPQIFSLKARQPIENSMKISEFLSEYSGKKTKSVSLQPTKRDPLNQSAINFK